MEALTSMKDAFKRDMLYIYPDGVDNPTQHRDLIRTYSMGWASALVSVGSEDALRRWTEEATLIVSEKWMPDLSWEWAVPPTS